MPRSPLPQRDGLDAAWLRTPRGIGWATMAEHLTGRLPRETPERVARMIDDGRFVDEQGVVITATTPYRGDRIIWFHRDLPDEAPVDAPIPVLYADERIVVVDKPPFLSTIPRGRHVRQSVLVKLRDRLGLPELGAAHRLDRLTAGVLLLTTERRWRPAYQTMFEHRQVTKTYRAVGHDRLPADWSPGETRIMRSHIRKERGVWQAHVVPDAEPNAETAVTLDGRTDGLCRFTLAPHTGKTHQLRLHLLSMGAPIVNDPLYPDVLDVALDDFSAPLQLLADTLAFRDPVDGTERVIRSSRELLGGDWVGSTP